MPPESLHDRIPTAGYPKINKCTCQIEAKEEKEKQKRRAHFTRAGRAAAAHMRGGCGWEGAKLA